MYFNDKKWYQSVICVIIVQYEMQLNVLKILATRVQHRFTPVNAGQTNTTWVWKKTGTVMTGT